MRETQIGVIPLIAFLLLFACTGIAFADRGVNATPEIQGISTATSADVIGTVTETDTGAWTLKGGPWAVPGPDDPVWIAANAPYGSYSNMIAAWNAWKQGINLPPGFDSSWISFWDFWRQSPGGESSVYTSALGTTQYPSVSYTNGYNDQYSGVSGRQTFVKSLALSTANKIADQSNIAAKTNIQFIAVESGRATRTEDLLLDGVAVQSTDASNSILCPFGATGLSIIPAYCTILQAGSTFDTTLTSTATSADTRFVGTDATIPVVLNYNVAAKGITLSDGTSSPMIGSVSAYLKVHVQEARNMSPTKSEDLVYSETSSASGLINSFSKSMSYSSQASAVSIPPVTEPF
jgi:hypothetical protein